MHPVQAAAQEKAKSQGIDLSKLPKNSDMNAESITANVHAMNYNCKDERAKFVLTSLINHLHDFVKDTSLTTEEWMTAIEFLTNTGKMCSDIRQEFILLSDTLGVTMLVDSINNAKPEGATESTVLGPFFAEDRHDVELGDSIASEGKGDYMFVEGRVTDTEGNPIPKAMIDTWETDGHGSYDTQYENRTGPDCRGRLYAADDGSFSFRAVVPVSYPIPDDGTVGKMMNILGRHVYRPAHLHIQISAPGFEGLTTSLFFNGDPYLTSDAVFGVKTSLITDVEIINDVSVTQRRGFRDPKPHAYLKRDFVLATPEQCAEARRKLTQVVAK
ncbi:intradiol ring-cleavage dioxygenase [Pholiota molesta]|nr:intradiol ring-cleavage dioxygenase [Pholiota molesta]